MGMMISRRRVMGDGKDLEYIQDGLVFWLDGIKKGNDPTAWTDLVGGAKFTYNQHSIVNTDNVAMDGAGLISSDSIIGYDYRTSTIEIVCNMSNANGGVVFYSAVDCGISFMVGSAGYSYAVGGDFDSQYNLTKPTGNVVVSISYDNIVLNGVTPTFNKVTNVWMGSSKTSIGGRDVSPYYFKACTIYAIRIYNRKLSTAEMTANQRVDNQRFNLGLSLNQ